MERTLTGTAILALCVPLLAAAEPQRATPPRGSTLEIKRVAQLPKTYFENRIGRQIGEFLPALGAHQQTLEGQGRRTYFHQGGRATYLVDSRTGAQDADPLVVEITQGDKGVLLWSHPSGRVHWQQAWEGSQPGSWYENILSNKVTGQPSVVIQGYLGGGATRYERQ